MRVFGVGSSDPATTTIGWRCFRLLVPQNPAGQGATHADDIEAPCIDRIEDVFQDMKQLAGKLGGELSGFDRRPNIRFRSATITTDGSSYKFYVRALRELGFGNNDALDHPEGTGFQMKFADDLWSHVIVNYPAPNAVNGFGEPLDPGASAPKLTVHCHGTDPMGG